MGAAGGPHSSGVSGRVMKPGASSNRSSRCAAIADPAPWGSCHCDHTGMQARTALLAANDGRINGRWDYPGCAARLDLPGASSTRASVRRIHLFWLARREVRGDNPAALPAPRRPNGARKLERRERRFSAHHDSQALMKHKTMTSRREDAADVPHQAGLTQWQETRAGHADHGDTVGPRASAQRIANPAAGTPWRRCGVN